MIGLILGVLLTGAPAGPLLVVPPDGGDSPAETAWVAEIVAESLPEALRLAGAPAIENADRIRAQAALEIPRSTLTRATCIRIGEALGADRLIMGTYGITGGRLAVSVRILDAERGSLSAPFSATGREDEILAVVARLAWELAVATAGPPHVTQDSLLASLTGPPFPAVRAFGQGLAARDLASRKKAIRAALGLAPAYHAARLALGRLEIEARDFKTALETLGRIPDGAAESRTARFLEIVACIESGQHREAAARGTRLVAQEPTPAALSNHAIALLRGGADVRASDVLKKAVEMEPTSTDLLFNLAWALLSEGRPEEAIVHLRGVVRNEPLDAHARLLLVWALGKAGRTSEEQQEWKGVVAMAPSYERLTTPDLRRRFERVLPSERLLVVDRGTRTETETAAGLIGRAERLATGGDASAAVRELTRAAYLDPYAPRIHLLLARALLAQGEKEKAVNEFRMALWSREDVAVRVELAQLLAEMGRTAEARAEASRALEVDPSSDAAKRLLGATPAK